MSQEFALNANPPAGIKLEKIDEKNYNLSGASGIS
jgi:hypothetical protein